MANPTVVRDLEGKVALVTGATSGSVKPPRCSWPRRGPR